VKIDRLSSALCLNIVQFKQDSQALPRISVELFFIIQEVVMDHRQQQGTRANQEAEVTRIRRALDGSIDMCFYRRRAHCLRSGVAWDTISHMSRMLPFFRRDDASPRPGRTDCTML
jgi:hypothetical protein